MGRVEERLARIEGVGGPGRGVLRLVVQAMNVAKEAPVMDQPVASVEPGVVQHDQRHAREREIAPAVRVGRGI